MGGWVGGRAWICTGQINIYIYIYIYIALACMGDVTAGLPCGQSELWDDRRKEAVSSNTGINIYLN